MTTMADPTPDEDAALRDQAKARAAAVEASTATIVTRLRALMAGNRNYLALAAPTAAETRRQTDKLTRQMNALIRLTLADLADISDTAEA